MPDPICPTGTTYVPGGRKYDRKVEGFCIDTKPVSNKSYNEFLIRKNKTLPSYKQYRHDRRAKKPLVPVAYISYKDARKYCRSRGMRLPYRNEWLWALVNIEIRNSLFMGMISKSGKTPFEFIESGRPSRWGAWITGVLDPGMVRFTSGSCPTSAITGSLRGEATIFRCAIEPKKPTFLKKNQNWIIGLAAGLLLGIAGAILVWKKIFSKKRGDDNDTKPPPAPPPSTPVKPPVEAPKGSPTSERVRLRPPLRTPYCPSGFCVTGEPLLDGGDPPRTFVRPDPNTPVPWYASERIGKAFTAAGLAIFAIGAAIFGPKFLPKGMLQHSPAGYGGVGLRPRRGSIIPGRRTPDVI